MLTQSKVIETLEQYYKFVEKLGTFPPAEQIATVRYLCRTDLFFLLWYGCGRRDIAHPWLLARCKEVQESPDGHLDLWAREHYKSTIITFGKTIQDLLASHGDEPLPEWKGLEPTVGIFSCTRPIAKGFLRQIKREFERNELLINLFPDVLWDNPGKLAPKWSEDDGLILKRKSNPKESTVEAWGLVDGQPTSRHFNILVYDDVVTIDNVRSPLMIAKTTESWELSSNLGARPVRARYVGTRYHYNDSYREMMSRGVVQPRIYAATQDGTVDGEPWLMSRDELQDKYRKQGVYTFSCQMLQNPVADKAQGFKKDWLRFSRSGDGTGLNVYITVDPANEKKQTSDYTVFCVIGLGQDQNYYLLDIVRDRLNLTERADQLFRLHRKWRPISVGYEAYGMQVDVSYLQERMSREHYHFDIKELGGSVAKNDRIKKLIPVFEQGHFYLPDSRFYTQYDNNTIDLIDVFINEEFLAFPVPVHDDMLDALARILDDKLGAIFPRQYDDEKTDRYQPKHTRSHSSWAA